MRRIVLTALATFVALSQPLLSPAAMTTEEEQAAMTVAGGAWHAGKLVSCADGVVTAVQPRLETTTTAGAGRFSSGVSVEFKLPTAPKFLNGQSFATARVVHYDSEPGNKLMESENAGDRVQVCLVSFPTQTRDLQSGKSICDPNTDPRGMVYRIYDYTRRAAYVGPDSQHSCGGA